MFVAQHTQRKGFIALNTSIIAHYFAKTLTLTFNALTCCSKFIYQENVAVVYHRLATEVVSLSKIAGPLFPQRIFGIHIFSTNIVKRLINTIVVKEIRIIKRGDINRREKRYSREIFQLKTVHNGLAVKLLSSNNNLYYNPDKQAPTEFIITPLDTLIIRHGKESDFMPVEIKCVEL